MIRAESNASSSSVESFYSCLSAEPTLPSLLMGEYEVFLSFRGPDVRQTFADCLYSCLVRSKIRTFRDEEELRKGETIHPSLIQAIIESKIYIPILTQSYASSKWCLQELAKMVDCWKRGGGGNGGPIILPVFYLVDPRDARHQDSGSYKEAFEQHSLKHDQETIAEWKEALQEVGKMKGWHVTESDGHGVVIDQIFTEVESQLRANYTLVTDELVGIDYYVEEVLKLLNLDSASEKIVGIHGMGGHGKTTLAKAVYNKVSTQFERCCFLENIREMLSKKDGAVTIQNKIISDILRKDSSEAKDSSDGIRVIKERVSRHKLLIVLDDVDERFQFEDILGKLCVFSMDSRFLVTTRDTRVLELLQEYKLFELGEMNHDHSLELFSKHAFRVNYPPGDYASLSKEFVQVAAGLPLALKVIGSLLFDMDKEFWEAKLVELKDLPPTKVQERLKISYNDLIHNEKQIFLDVACLFGVNKEEPVYMWSDCDFYPASTIGTLVRRSLLRIDENKKFWMHDHLRDLGRTIVCEENNQNPYKRSRIWSNRDAIGMLKDREGNDRVEALRVDLYGEDVVLTNNKIKQLSRLRYLEVRNGRLAGNFKEVLPNMRWLRLYRCHSIPVDINLKKLVILDLEYCSVGDGWRGWNRIKVADKLKVVNLSWCEELKIVPDLSNCRALEQLNFGGCWMMSGELDIGNFKNLRALGVRSTKITKLKGDIGKLQNLQKLDVSHTSLEEMPSGICKLSCLESLDLTLTHPKKPPFTETLPDSLKRLTISSSYIPSLPSSLNYLYISHDKRLLRLPNLGNLTTLTRLYLDDVGIREIPGLGKLKRLETLRIERAPSLGNLDGLENLVLLKELSLHACSALRKVPNLAKLRKLHKLKISACQVLAEIHGVGELWESLSHFHINYCFRLTGMEILQSMVRLGTLELKGLQLTKKLSSSFSMFTKLRILYIGDMSMKQFPDFSNLKNLKELKISDCRELVEVTRLETLELLELLEIWYCSSLRQLTNLSGLIKLKRLLVMGCQELTEVRGLGRLESLEYLLLDSCTSITKLPNLSGLKKLRELHLRECRQLKKVKGLEELDSLQFVDINKRSRVGRILKSVSRYGKQLVPLSVRRAVFISS